MDIFSSSAISREVFSSFSKMPIFLAMDAAVNYWSPVTMITLIPAVLHFLMASGTASLGGSIREMRPKN
jgi:hypothetical protein